jgi:hypothetical protein
MIPFGVNLSLYQVLQNVVLLVAESELNEHMSDLARWLHIVWPVPEDPANEDPIQSFPWIPEGFDSDVYSLDLSVWWIPLRRKGMFV